jgi:tetratricopeptide (TPR) repeat protein
LPKIGISLKPSKWSTIGIKGKKRGISLVFLLIWLIMFTPSGGEKSNYLKSYEAALKSQDFDEAIHLCSQAIESGKFSGNDLSEIYKNRGKAWVDKKEYDLAILDYNKAIEIDPNDADAYLTRGTTWFDKGDYDHFQEDYNTFIAIAHHDPGPNFNYGKRNFW